MRFNATGRLAQYDMNVVVIGMSSAARNTGTFPGARMAPLTKHTGSMPLGVAISLLTGLLAGACFDSDEMPGTADGSTSESTDTVAVYNDDTGDDSDPNWTAEETGPAETTCRDAITCIVTCQASLFLDPQAEPDLGCFLECDEGLSTEEAYLLIYLAECIGNTCTADGLCGAEDSSDQDCLVCIAANAQDPQPPGCLEEALACD